MIFFIDRCLGKEVIASKLRAKGVRVEVHDDHFAPTEKDEVWLDAVGKKGWVVFSKDEAIRHRQNERDALIKAKVRAFFLTGGSATAEDNADIILRAMNRIEKLLTGKRKAIIAVVRSNGSLVQIH